MAIALVMNLRKNIPVKVSTCSFFILPRGGHFVSRKRVMTDALENSLSLRVYAQFVTINCMLPGSRMVHSEGDGGGLNASTGEREESHKKNTIQDVLGKQRTSWEMRQYQPYQNRTNTPHILVSILLKGNSRIESMFATFAYLWLKLLPGSETRLKVGFKAQCLFAQVVEGNLHVLGVRLEFCSPRQALYERQQLLPFTATHLAEFSWGIFY